MKTQKEMDHNYYIRNRKKVIARNRHYANTHKEKTSLRQKKWYQQRKKLKYYTLVNNEEPNKKFVLKARTPTNATWEALEILKWSIVENYAVKGKNPSL